MLFASLATAAAFPDGLWTGASYDGIEAAEEAVALHQVEVLLHQHQRVAVLLVRPVIVLHLGRHAVAALLRRHVIRGALHRLGSRIAVLAVRNGGDCHKGEDGE